MELTSLNFYTRRQGSCLCSKGFCRPLAKAAFPWTAPYVPQKEKKEKRRRKKRSFTQATEAYRLLQKANAKKSYVRWPIILLTGWESNNFQCDLHERPGNMRQPLHMISFPDALSLRFYILRSVQTDLQLHLPHSQLNWLYTLPTPTPHTKLTKPTQH